MFFPSFPFYYSFVTRKSNKIFYAQAINTTADVQTAYSVWHLLREIFKLSNIFQVFLFSASYYGI